MATIDVIISSDPKPSDEAMSAIAQFADDHHLSGLDGAALEVVDYFESGDGAKWAAYWNVRGKHGSSEYLGFSPTNSPIVVHLLTVAHLDSKRARILHTEFDRLHSLHQMGVRAVGRPVLR